ncbi:MAG TPA: STAS domain-containing protein [Pyrinomonadaceae bacterium]
MLKVHTTKFGNVALLCVQGKIIRGETDALRSAVLAQADTSVVVLDLAHVNTIDAGGLGVMLELREQIESRGIEFRVENVTQLVKRILEITKLDSVFRISGSDLPYAAIRSTPAMGFEMARCA